MSTSEATGEIFLGRQPILDRAEQLHAFELLFRAGPHNRAEFIDGAAATAQVIQYAFGELGADTVLGPFRGFINIDASMLMSDVLELLPHRLVTLELLETVEITPDVVARCKELKQGGFKLALDDVREISAPYHPMLEIADYLKVDIKLVPPTELAELTQQARAWPVALLAEKIDTREEAAQCRELGYQYFQGYYFARPLLIPGKKLSPSETILLRLLALLLADAETSEIEALIRQSPPLTLNLLRIVNTAAMGLSRRLASIGDAITVLGRRQLKRWVQLLVFANAGGGSLASPLLQTAAMRGRFMEALAERARPHDTEAHDRAFMCGMLSLMPVALQVTLGEILATLPLDEMLREALLNGKGQLGTLLAAAEGMETGDTAALQRAAATLALPSLEAIAQAQLEALRWAQKLATGER